MHMSTRISGPLGRLGRAGAAVTAGSLLLAGCAAAPKNSDQDLHSRLPASVRTAGVLRIAADPNYPPVEFKAQDGQVTGIDPDIAEAVGKHLGVRIEFVDTPFDKLIPGLQAKQYDAVMSALSDNRQRRDGTDDSGKQIDPGVDFVDYFIAGSSILVGKGNPQGINTLDDLCGRIIAVQRGTTQATIVQRQTGACEKTRKPMTVHVVDTDKAAIAEVASGKAAADLDDFPVAAYTAQQGADGAQFQVAGHQLQPGPYGIALAKDNAELQDVLVKAVNQVIRSGEYDTILQKWNVGAGAAQNAVVNGGF